MRRAARIDANQPEIVKGLREAGVEVQSLAGMGDGVPDLLVSWGGANILLEVKDPDQPPSKRKLTDDQVTWHAKWKGPCFVVTTTQEALQRVYEVAA